MFTKRERDNLIIAITQHKQNIVKYDEDRYNSHNYQASDKALNKLLAEHKLDKQTEAMIHD